jgi:hypothetical protein
MRRATLLLLFLLAGCGARSVLTLDEGAASNGGEGGAAAAGASGPGGAGGTTTSSDPPKISVVDACVIAVSCGKDTYFDHQSVSACIGAFSQLGWSLREWHNPVPTFLPDPALAARILACADETGSDCEAFRTCYGGDWVSPFRWREEAYCDGNRLTHASGGPSFDCGALGATCQDLPPLIEIPRASCNAEPCTESNGSECDGTVASFCRLTGEHVVFDCGASGRECQSAPEPGACVGTGAECDVDSSYVSCSGSVATYCSGGRLATYDCASNEHLTGCNDGVWWITPVCTAKAKSCSVWNQLDECAGAVIELCLDGERVDVDCTSLGFSGCDDSGQVTRCTE